MRDIEARRARYRRRRRPRIWWLGGRQLLLGVEAAAAIIRPDPQSAAVYIPPPDTRDGGSVELDALAGGDMRRGIIIEDSQVTDFVDGIRFGPVEQSRRVSGDRVSLVVVSLQPESG